MTEKKNPNANHRKRLRDRFEREGADSFEPHELLELFLFDAIPRVNTNPIAHALIDRFGSLDGVLRAPKDKLMKVRGIGERSAEYIVTTFAYLRDELETSITSEPVSSFERASNVLIWHRLILPADCATVLSLDGAHRIIRYGDLFYPSLEAICGECISAGAVRVIVGVGKSFGLDVEELKLSLIKNGTVLSDVISVDGYKTESLI